MRLILAMVVFLVTEHSVAMKRIEYQLCDVENFGIRCRRTLDVFLNGKFVSKSFQMIHSSLLKETVDKARRFKIWKLEEVPNANSTREQRKERNAVISRNRIIKNSNAFLGLSKETECNLATANLSIILCDGSAIGAENLLSNGISPGDLKEDILYRVFSTGYFANNLVDRKIVADWLRVHLNDTETYYDTELQICNKLFGKSGEFLDLIDMYLKSHKKSLENIKAIVLSIYTENPPCGYCGPLLMHLVRKSSETELNIVRVLNAEEIKYSGVIKKKLQAMLTDRKNFFIVEISSNLWGKYKLIYNSCDGITDKQYVQNEKFDTLEPNYINPKNGIPYILWHPFSLPDHFSREKSISSIIGEKIDQEARQLQKNLRHIPMHPLPSLALSEFLYDYIPPNE